MSVSKRFEDWHRDRSSVHHHISGVKSSGIGRRVVVPGLTDFPDNRRSLFLLETIITMLRMKDNERFSTAISTGNVLFFIVLQGEIRELLPGAAGGQANP